MPVKNPHEIETLQDVFDTAVTRVLQNQLPAFSKKRGTCAYRTEPDSNGHVAVCAVGALIPDELYVHCEEGQGVENQDIRIFTPALRSLMEWGADTDARDLLLCLQCAHDGPAERWADGVIDRAEFQARFKEHAERAAKNFSLNPAALYAT